MQEQQVAEISPIIVLNPADDVGVARISLQPGAPLGEGLVSAAAISQGHKIALHPIASGQPVRKYGQVIGIATADIGKGEHVHVHNLDMDNGPRSHSYCADARPTDFVPEAERATFNGYLRADGRVGTRNYIAVISSVTCSATVSRAVADYFNNKGGLEGFDGVDGVVALTHGGGCSINGYGEGFTYLERTLAGYARHPNVGGVVMIGLGCETNQISHLMQTHNLQESPTFRALTIQTSGGTRKTIEAGVRCHSRDAAGGECRKAYTATGLRPGAGARMRRLGRIFRYFRQPGVRLCGGSSGAQWWHGGAQRNAGNLRRRASADQSCSAG